MPIASAMTAAHSDSPVVTFVAQWPEIQPLVSRGQIVQLTSHDGRTDRRTDTWTHGHTTIILVYDITGIGNSPREQYTCRQSVSP